jgi:hypothetical protein
LFFPFTPPSLKGIEVERTVAKLTPFSLPPLKRGIILKASPVSLLIGNIEDLRKRGITLWTRQLKTREWKTPVHPVNIPARTR